MIEAIALDTNVLIYSSGFNDASRRDRINSLLGEIIRYQICIPTQALGEFYVAAVRKALLEREEAARLVKGWSERFLPIAADPATFTTAVDLASRHQLQFWDALILETAASARCQLLLSEDMSDGFVWRGCTVVNPFADAPHPLLKDALASS